MPLEQRSHPIRQLHLPLHTLERIKAAAKVRDVPYQSLIKVWLEEKLSA